MISTWIDEARASCVEALASPGLLGVAEALREAGVTETEAAALVQAVADRGAREEIVQLKRTVAPGDGVALERYLLVLRALRSLPAVPELSVHDDVKRLFCEAFGYFSREPKRRAEPSFEVDTPSFGSMCRIATLRRFPAGELEWEVSGLPRSWLLRIRPRDWPRLAACLWKLGGRAPLYYPHLGALRPKRIMLVEREFNRSYYRMARSLERQPQIRGLLASAWFFSPDTYRVSPHLSWLAQHFLDNGGMVAIMGAAGRGGDGALSLSNRRKQLAEAGEYRPTLGLVLWPRDAMLRWAGEHPEFADQPAVPVEA